MNYNTEYLDVHYGMMNAFMIDASPFLLDVSYSKEGKRVTIQLVLVDGAIVSDELFLEKLKANLISYEICVKKVYLTKEKFNESKGGWRPKYYEWLENLLFSKSEAI